MPAWHRLPHRWGPLTMIALLSKCRDTSRWLARHEVLEQLVWVDRYEGSDATTEPFTARTPCAGAASVLAIERCTPIAPGAPSIGMVLDFVPSISLEAALAAAREVWSSELDALASVRGVIAPMLHVSRETRAALDLDALAVDADARMFVARTINERDPSIDVSALAAATLVRVIERIATSFEGPRTGALARAIAARGQLDLAELDAMFTAHFGVDFGAHFSMPTRASDERASLTSTTDAPSSLDANPLASAALARLAASSATLDALPAANEVATTLVDAIRARMPLCANRLVLLASVARARKALRELSIRDSSIDPRALALLGPLEPTWIPLHPNTKPQVVTIDGVEVTLCPMQWDELQATASRQGGELRFCLACARGVRSVVVDDARRVVASSVCAFDKRRPK